MIILFALYIYVLNCKLETQKEQKYSVEQRVWKNIIQWRSSDFRYWYDW